MKRKQYPRVILLRLAKSNVASSVSDIFHLGRPWHLLLSRWNSSFAVILRWKVTRGDFLPEVTRPTAWRPTRGACAYAPFKWLGNVLNMELTFDSFATGNRGGLNLWFLWRAGVSCCPQPPRVTADQVFLETLIRNSAGHWGTVIQWWN